MNPRGRPKRGGTAPLAMAALLLLADGAAAQSLPAAIAVPGATIVATFHAVGAQVYECKSGSDGKLAWTFREPIATLILDGKTVGRHYAGPTWEHMDGSVVVAKGAGSAPGATADDIAWLKLEVLSHRGNGTLDAASAVQRINTSGGVLRGSCDHAGRLMSVPYSADYVFLRAGG